MWPPKDLVRGDSYIYAPEKRKTSIPHEENAIALQHPAVYVPIKPCFHRLSSSNLLAHTLLPSTVLRANDEPIEACQEFSALHNSLSFVIVVPILCITLILLCAARDRSDVTLLSEGTGRGNRSVRLLTRSCTSIHHLSCLKIILHADLVSADFSHSTMLVEWTVRWDTSNDSCTDVNIFIDT